MIAGEVGGAGDSVTGLGGRQVQGVGQVIAQPSAAGQGGIAAQPVDSAIAHRRQRPLHRFHPGEHCIGSLGRRLIPRQLGKAGHRGLQGGQPVLDISDVEHRHSQSIEQVF